MLLSTAEEDKVIYIGDILLENEKVLEEDIPGFSTMCNDFLLLKPYGARKISQRQNR